MKLLDRKRVWAIFIGCILEYPVVEIHLCLMILLGVGSVYGSLYLIWHCVARDYICKSMERSLGIERQCPG